MALVILVPVAGAAHTESPVLKLTDDGRTAGFITLDWFETAVSSGGTIYELQRKAAGSPDWQAVYMGPDTATTLTGLRNGTYLFRIRRAGLEWSAPLQIKIAHHPLSRALLFFFCGLVLFVILLTVTLMPDKSPDNAVGDQ